MPWQPKYTNTDKLLYTIRQIGEAIGEIRSFRFQSGTVALLESQARELSTYASTSIAGNPLALTDVKRLLKNRPEYIRDTEHEVLNYNQALKQVYSEVRQQNFTLNQHSIEKIQKTVVAGLMDNPSDIGKLRERAVVIRNPLQIELRDEITFIPPDYQDVPRFLDHLIQYIQQNSGKIDPIILAGIFHRQYVIIHPFMDGNGRSARLITTALLGSEGFNFFEIFSFEGYYNRNIRRYFNEVGLTGDYYEIHNGIDFTSWLEYFADGILDELKRVQKSLLSSTSQQRIEPHLRNVLDYIEKHGSITQKQYGEFSERSLAARKQDFKKLLLLNLIESKGGGRSTYYALRLPSNETNW